MWGGDGHKWTNKDRILVQALHYYEASLCVGCGQPARIAHDPKYEGWFQIRKVECVACAELERDADSKKKPAKGEKRFLVNELPWGATP